MNIYKETYDNLVNSRKHLKEQWKPVGSGLSRHRIVPGHLGGEYTDGNCTYLTLREHIIAHWLLWKINSLKEDQYAYKMLAGTKPDCYPSRKGKPISPQHKAAISARHKGKITSEHTKEKMRVASTGKKHTQETKDKIRAIRLGSKSSDATKAKITAALTGRPVSAETRAKIGAAHKGKKVSAETRAKISAARKKKL